MSATTRQNVAGGVYMTGLVVLAGGLGWLARSVMVGALVLASLIALHLAAVKANDHPGFGVVLVAWFGAWGISYAGMTAGFAGRWLWSIPWALAALIYTTIAISSRGSNAMVTMAATALAAGAVIAAVAHPLWLHGTTREEAQELLLAVARRWWWVPVAAIAALFALALLAAGIEALRSRRAARPPAGAARPERPQPAPRTLERPARPAPPPVTPRPAPPAVTPRPAAVPPAARPATPAVPAVQRIEGGVRRSKPAPAAPAVVRHKPPAPLRRDDAGRTILVSGDELPVPPQDPGGPGPRSTILVPDTTGTLLYRCPVPIADLAATGEAHLVLLGDGRLLRWRDGILDELHAAPTPDPIGVEARAGTTVATYRSSILVLAGEHPADGDLREHRLPRPVSCSALNPYGTIVALAHHDGPTVSVLLLGPAETQPVVDVPDGTSALAFSADGGELAVGTGAGTVQVVDMATRRVTRHLAPPPGRPDRIIALVPGPAGGWLAALAGGLLAAWDAAGTPTSSVQEPTAPTSLAVAEGRHRLVVGCLAGRARILPLPLGPAIADHDLGADPVVRVAVGDGDRAVVAATRDGAVHGLALP